MTDTEVCASIPTTLRTKEEHILRLLDSAVSEINDNRPKVAIQLLTQAVYSAKPTPEIHRECRSVLTAAQEL